MSFLSRTEREVSSRRAKLKEQKIHEAAEQMVIEYNKKIKVVSPKPHLNGGKSKPNSILGKPNSNPQQVHLHEKDDPTENQPLETSTQTMVHECLTECGTDPSDFHNVMTVFNAKGGISSQVIRFYRLYPCFR